MKRKSFKLILFIILVLIASYFTFGCSNGESGNNEQQEENKTNVSNNNSHLTGSCDTRVQLGYCYEYRGTGWSANDAKTECDLSPGGVYSDSPCPEVDIVGTCNFFPGSNKDKEIFYVFYKPMDESTAKLSCPGKFVPKL